MLTLLIYNQSSNKKQLDRYIKRVRGLQPLTEEEWEDLRSLAEHEKSVLHPHRAGFQNIMYKGKDVISGATIKPDNMGKQSFFYPHEKEGVV